VTDRIVRFQSIRGWKYRLAEAYRFLTNYQPAGLIRTRHDFIVISPDGWLEIRRGYAWDGPSGPTIDTLNFMRGSLIHDALYQLIREGKLEPSERLYADRVLRRVCLEDGMSRFRAWYVYQAVRMFGGAAIDPRRTRARRVRTAP